MIAPALILLIASGIAACFEFVAAQSTRPTVTVQNGTIVGAELPTFSQDFFGGVHYAQPPIGDLRLRLPVAINTSFTNATFDASSYGPTCPGHGNGAGVVVDEDCLTLNVVRPHNTSVNDNLPVMLWIYGGAYQAGASSDPSYNLSYIVSRSVDMATPIIAISINYRVSHFGFMNSREIFAEGLSNIGIWDQRLALRWVQENIAAFGGDPSKVTIWGESAGAESVSMHLIAFGGTGNTDPPLFRAAILESGSPTTEMYSTPDLYQQAFDNFTATVNCFDAPDVLACLRSVPYALFFAAGGNTTTWISPWQPVVDGDFIPQFASQLLKEGKFVSVPILSGANTDEGVTFGPGGINTDDELVDALYGSFLGLAQNSTLRAITSLYSDNLADGAPFGTGNLPSFKGGVLDKKADAIYGDIDMIGTRRNLVEVYANSSASKAWSYRFDHLPEYLSVQQGVGHGAEVPFVFNNPLTRGSSPDDIALSLTIQSQWISFAVHLDPNFHGVEDIPYWPDYANGTNNIVYRNSTEGGITLEVDDFREEGIAFINEWAMDLFR